MTQRIRSSRYIQTCLVIVALFAATAAAQASMLLLGMGPIGVVSANISSDRVYVTNSGNQTVTSNSSLSLAWDTESYDDGGMHDTVTNNSRLTAPTNGVYVITCSQVWAGDADINGISVQGTIRLDGTTVIAFAAMVPASTVTTALNISTTYKMTAGQYVECRAFYNNANTATVNATNSSFSMARVQD